MNQTELYRTLHLGKLNFKFLPSYLTLSIWKRERKTIKEDRLLLMIRIWYAIKRQRSNENGNQFTISTLQATRISWSAAIAGRCLRIWASCSSTSGITANCGSHVNVTPSMEQPQVRTRKKDLLSFVFIYIYIYIRERIKNDRFGSCEFRYVLLL